MKLRRSISKPKFGAKPVKIKQALDDVSQDVAAREHKPKQTTSLQTSSDGKTRVKVNISGNRRGMHMQAKEMNSEEMKKKQSMRRLWNKKMPSLHCSNCQFSAQCPQYRSGYECSFLPFLNSHQIDSTADLIFYAKELAGENVRRSQTMLLMERLSGAKPDLDTSEALAHTFQQLLSLHKQMTDMGDASIEVETTDKSIIAGLFGGLDDLLGSTRDAGNENLGDPLFIGEEKLDNATVRGQVKDSGEPVRAISAELVEDFTLNSENAMDHAPEVSIEELEPIN